MATRKEHFLQAQQCLILLRDNMVNGVDVYKWIAELRRHVSSSGMPMATYGTSEAELCKIRISWHEFYAQNAAEVIDASMHTNDQPWDNLDYWISQLLYHTQSARMSLESVGFSREKLSAYRKCNHQRAAQQLAEKLRGLRGDLLGYTLTRQQLESESSRAGTTLEELGLSPQILLEILVHQVL